MSIVSTSAHDVGDRERRAGVFGRREPLRQRFPDPALADELLDRFVGATVRIALGELASSAVDLLELVIPPTWS